MFSGLLSSPILPRVLAAFDGRPDKGLLWGPAVSADLRQLAGWKVDSELITEESGTRIFQSSRQLAREARCFMNRLGLDQVRLQSPEWMARRDPESVTFSSHGGFHGGWNEIAIGTNFLSLKRRSDFQYAGMTYGHGLNGVPGGPHWRHDYFASFLGPALQGVRRYLDLPMSMPLEVVAASLAATMGISEEAWDRQLERSAETRRLSRRILECFAPRVDRGFDQMMSFDLGAWDELDTRIRVKPGHDGVEEQMSFGFSGACRPGAWLRPLPEFWRPLWDLAGECGRPFALIP